MTQAEKLLLIASKAHRAANGSLDMAGRKASVGAYKSLLREIRDLARGT